MIWHAELDASIFKNYTNRSRFHAALEDVSHPDPKDRKTVIDVVTTLMGLPYHFQVPMDSFRREN